MIAEHGRRDLPAGVAIDAGRVHEKIALDVLRQAICNLSHDEILRLRPAQLPASSGCSPPLHTCGRSTGPRGYPESYTAQRSSPSNHGDSSDHPETGSSRVKLSVLDQSPVPDGHSRRRAAKHHRPGAPRRPARLRALLDRRASRHGHARLPRAGNPDRPRRRRNIRHPRRLRRGAAAPLQPTQGRREFRMLHALYPNRIDLGIGRAPGGGPLESYALRRERIERRAPTTSPSSSPSCSASCVTTLARRPPLQRNQGVARDARRARSLARGSSQWSAIAAAQLGLPYAFAHFIGPEPTRAAIEHYHSHFVPSARRSRAAHPRRARSGLR